MRLKSPNTVDTKTLKSISLPPFAENIYLLFIFVLLGHIVLFFQQVTFPLDLFNTAKTLGVSLFRLAFWLSSIPLLLFLMKDSKFGVYVTRFLIVICFLLFLFELYLYRVYESFYTHSIASVLANSNINEGQEFFESTITLWDVALCLGWSVSLFFVALGIARLTYSKAARLFSRFGSLRRLILATVLIGLISQGDLYLKARAGYMVYTTLSSYDRLVWSSYSVWAESSSIQSYMDKLEQSIGDVSPSQLSGGHNVVLILGESLRRDYMSCYGYAIPNTPRLDSLVRRDSMLLFSDVSSPASSTVLSLVHTLSTKQTTDSKRWYEYPFINMLMKKAGYRTAWLSNQESSGFMLQSLSAVASLSEKVVYTVRRSIDDNTQDQPNYDELLLPLIDTLKSNRKPNQTYFDVFHLMGSHYTYSSRYPSSFARFGVDSLRPELTSKQRQFVADYVNSVYYNDFVVSEIIKRYQNEASLVIYLSDHGEVLYDDSQRPEYMGHGGAIVPQGLRIPFIVYASPLFRERYPDVWLRLKNAVNRPIMTDILPQSLCGLLGIRGTFSNPSLEFFGDTYDESRKRVVVGNDQLYEQMVE